MMHPTLKNAETEDTATLEKDLPFVARHKSGENPDPSVKELRVGDLCPKCHMGHLDYDGVLNLACGNCGYVLSGGAGCT